MRRIIHQTLLWQRRVQYCTSSTLTSCRTNFNRQIAAAPLHCIQGEKQAASSGLLERQCRTLQSGRASFERRFSTTTCNNRLTSSITWHVAHGLSQHKVKDVVTEETIEDCNVEDADRLIPQYLISIAIDPYVNPTSVVKLFQLYAATRRSLMKDKVEYSEHFNKFIFASEQAMKSMSYNELKQMAVYLDEVRNQNLNVVNRLINSLCQECSTRLKDIPLDEGIQCFEILLGVLDNGIALKPFYGTFVEYFLEQIDSATEDDLIKLMYYGTLNQRTSIPELVKRSLERLQECTLDSMTFETSGIIANSVLKSGMKLYPEMPLLIKLEKMLSHKLLDTCSSWSELELFSIVAIINLLRLSKYSNDLIIATVESFLLTCDKSFFNKETIPSLLAFLSSNKYYNKDVYSRVEEQMYVLIRGNKGSRMELPDYARVTWSFNNAGHHCSDKFIELLFTELSALFAMDKANKNMLKFVDTILSLAMMGRIDKSLLIAAFQPLKRNSKHYKEASAKKLGTRLKMLRECSTIELPELRLPLPSNREMVESAEVNPHPALLALYVQLEHLNETNDSLVSVSMPIRSLNSYSICLSRDKLPSVSSADGRLTEVDDDLLQALIEQNSNICIEVTDDQNTVRDMDTVRMNGFMKFKVRLMTKMGWKCIIINTKMIEECDDLRGLLTEQIKQMSRPDSLTV